MPYQDLEPVSKQLTIVVGLVVVGMMAFGLALSFYRNILFEITLEHLRTQNMGLRLQNIKSQADLDYYRSAQYKDKYAKENLGKVQPGESAILIAESHDEQPLAPDGKPLITEEQQMAFDALLRQMPVIEHWKLFFFQRDRIDVLKRGAAQ